MKNGWEHHPECHPERVSRSDRVEVFRSEIRSELQNVAKKNRERDVWKRGAGSAMSLLNAYSAFELFLMRVDLRLPPPYISQSNATSAGGVSETCTDPACGGFACCGALDSASSTRKTSTSQKFQSRSFAALEDDRLEFLLRSG